MQQQSKPIFSYYGGKQKMASKIVPLIPEHQMYVEPFFGGGAIMFAKGVPDVSTSKYHEVINDRDERIINFYRVFQDPIKSQELLHRIEYTPHSEAEYRRSKDILKNPDKHRDVLVAWAWYVNVQQSFGNKALHGWQRIRKTPDRNPAAICSNAKQRLPLLFERFKNVTICCDDALKVIQQRDSETAFFYLDPPYPDTRQDSYVGSYNWQNLNELIELLSTIKGKFILSNYTSDKIEVPDSWKLLTFETRAGLGRVNCNKRVEGVWMNY